MKKKIGILLLCIICIVCCCASAFGDGLLQQIYVDLNPINIVIDGEDKNPPSDMQPMIYNDRTYVPLRYVAESLGKDVEWDGDTRTVYIGEHQPMQKEIFESFTGPVSKNWEMKGSWTADGPNGYVGATHSAINLIEFLPNKQCDFTVEFEYLSTKKRQGLGICLGKDENGKLADEIKLNDGSIGLGTQSCRFDIEANNYYKYTFDVCNGQCIVYIDDNYLHTFTMSTEIPALHIYILNNNGTTFFDGRIRNINVKLND